MNVSQSENKLNIVSTDSGVYYKYIHVIQDVRINSIEIVSEVYTTSVSYYTFPYDGYFKISEIKLPTTSGNYYWVNDEVIYDPSGNVISVEELLEVDPTGTNIVRNDLDYITLYFLRDYYLKLLKSKYLKNICNCGCGCIDKQDKVKLDTLTMGLDLIEALMAQYQYYEVQRIIEKMMVCFGIVSNDCNCR